MFFKSYRSKLGIDMRYLIDAYGGKTGLFEFSDGEVVLVPKAGNPISYVTIIVPSGQAIDDWYDIESKPEESKLEESKLEVVSEGFVLSLAKVLTREKDK